jgi:Bacterial PH domain
MAGVKTLEFPPDRQRGLPIHVTLILALGLIAAVAAWLATNEPISLRFALYILAAGAAFAPLPFLVYRLYSLQRGTYHLDRDKLTITWGLRVEKIPVSDIEWVRPPSALDAPLRLPFFRLPGSVLGHRHMPDTRTVEFIASEVKNLLLVATRNRVLAISPADTAGFVQNLQNAMEMGSLSPEAAESVFPSFVVVEAWKSPLARYFWLATLLLNAGLLAWVSLLAPDLAPIPLGFLPSEAPGELVPGVGLILLPVLSIFLSALGWVLGLAFYRREDQRPLAHILWVSSTLATILFLLAVLFIVSAT